MPVSRRGAPPDFTLRQLSYFIAAAEEGTVAGAARRMHVSNSAMSDAITELERIIGEPLCIRRQSRGLVLTPVGANVLSQAREILEGSDQLARLVQTGPEELAGPLAIACYPTLAPTILPAILHDFGRQHPGIEMSVVEATHDQLEGKLESGLIDAAFVYDFLVPGTPRRRELYRLVPHLLLAADHPLAGEAAVDLEQVVDGDMILFDASPSSANTMSIFAARGLRPVVRYRSSNFEAVRTLVGRSLGYSVLANRPRIDLTYEGLRVVEVDITPPPPELAVHIIWPGNRRLSRRTEALVEFAAAMDWLRPVSGR